MARRGATARVNLVKASTGPAAQLVTAKTGARQIAAAPLVHAPTPALARRNATTFTPVQNNNEKQPHQGFATQTATVGGTDYQLEQDGNNYILKDAAGNVKRTYSKSQMDAIGRRGTSGATMDPLDQAAFFRFSGGKTEREITLEDEARKAANAAAADKAKQDYAHQLAMEKQQAQLDAQQKRTETAAAGRVDAAKIKAEADEKAKELARQAHERELGRAGDMTDEDFAEFQRMGGKQYATWGYSAKDQQRIDDLNAEYDNAMASGNYTADDLQTMRSEIDARIGNIKKTVNKRTNTPDVDAQPIVSKDGKFYWDNKAGNWSPLKQEKDTSGAERQKWVLAQYSDWLKGEGMGASEETRKEKLAEIGLVYDEVAGNPNKNATPPNIVTNPADPANLSGVASAAMPWANQPPAPTATPSANPNDWKNFFK